MPEPAERIVWIAFDERPVGGAEPCQFAQLCLNVGELRLFQESLVLAKELGDRHIGGDLRRDVVGEEELDTLLFVATLLLRHRPKPVLERSPILPEQLLRRLAVLFFRAVEDVVAD